MKQILFVLLVVAVAASCKKTDEPKTGHDTLRAGKWKQSTGRIKVKGFNIDTTYDYFVDLPDCRKDDYLEFRTNFDGVVNTAANKCTSAESDESDFTWELVNNDQNLNVYTAEDFFGTSNVKSDVVSLSEDKLAIKYTFLTKNMTDTTRRDTITMNNAYTKF